MLQKAFYILLLSILICKHLPIQQIIVNDKNDIEFAELPTQETSTEEHKIDEIKYCEDINFSYPKTSAFSSLKLHWHIQTHCYLPNSLAGFILTPPPDNSCII